MTWVDWIPALTGLLYAAAAVGYALQGNSGLALAYTGYVLGNVGLIMAAVAARSA
jgi:hypothetical protein